MTDLESRFWAKVERRGPDECWLWQACCFRPRSGGYGSFRVDGKNVGAHRMAWIFANNGADPGALLVLHSCHNPRCCNPAHLRLGTVQDNVDDMFAAGRQPVLCGERRFNAKLTEGCIAEIRAMRGRRHREIAQRFGVSASLISNILRGVAWRHVPEVAA